MIFVNDLVKDGKRDTFIHIIYMPLRSVFCIGRCTHKYYQSLSGLYYTLLYLTICKQIREV